jgi:GTP:adenosylcobinamide-phosphate guanylyltransferase
MLGLIQSVRQRITILHHYKDHFVNAVKEIIAVYSKNHKKTDASFKQNTELLIITDGGTYSYHWTLKG